MKKKDGYGGSMTSIEDLTKKIALLQQNEEKNLRRIMALELAHQSLVESVRNIRDYAADRWAVPLSEVGDLQ